MKSILALVLLSSTVSFADVMECQSGGDKRLLDVSSVEKGCELKYTKGGNIEIKATQKIGDGKCIEVREKMQKTLEASGYTCAVSK